MTASAPPATPGPSARILLIESDAHAGATAREALGSDHEAITVRTGLDPEATPDLSPFDLVVLGQPHGGDGAALVDAIRRRARLPVVPLYRPSIAPLKRSTDFRAGARILFALEDCRARIRQHLEHPATPSGMGVAWGGFSVMLKARVFAFDGKPLDLTEVQSALLSILMQSAGEIVTKSQLQGDVFGHKPATGTNIIEVHISRLRDKLAAVGAPVWVENVRNAGYVLFWHPARSRAAIPMPDPFLLIEGRPVRLIDVVGPDRAPASSIRPAPFSPDEPSAAARGDSDAFLLQGTRP